MKSPSVFDANIGVGDTKDRPSPVRDRVQLLAEMDRHGVERAIIYHVNSHESLVESTLIDAELEEWRNDRLLPQWTGWPTRISIERLRERHRAGDLMSVRVCAGERVLAPFQPWLYGDLLSWLSDIGVPVVV